MDLKMSSFHRLTGIRTYAYACNELTQGSPVYLINQERNLLRALLLSKQCKNVLYLPHLKGRLHARAVTEKRPHLPKIFVMQLRQEHCPVAGTIAGEQCSS